MLGDLFYQLGAAVGGLSAQVPGKPGAEHSFSGRGAVGHAGLVAGAAGTWLAARVLRPGPVSWTRIVIAGVAATFLADLAARTLDDGSPGGPSVQHDPDAILRRFGAGIAITAGYATLLYHRLPGPPLLRGLAFGALEVAAASRGGLVRVAEETPGVRYPLQGLALPLHEGGGPVSHLAFGIGLGLFYRADP